MSLDVGECLRVTTRDWEKDRVLRLRKRLVQSLEGEHVIGSRHELRSGAKVSGHYIGLNVGHCSRVTKYV